jgi:cell division septum initiation protein DivIVA
MLRTQLSNLESEHNGSNPPSPGDNGVSRADTTEIRAIDVEQELNRLEEMILSSFRVPLTGKTLVDEEKLLEQLDLIRLSLPDAFNQAIAIIEQKQEIFLEAEEYGQQIVDAAQAKRVQILDENDIIRQAEKEAEQIRRQTQLECEAMMKETVAEIELKRRQTQQELEEMRSQAIAQAQQIEQGADEYADGVLDNIETDLSQMLNIIRNGRQQLNPNNSLQGKKRK